jgi:hypothetical protein
MSSQEHESHGLAPQDFKFFVVPLSNNQARDARQFLNCLSPQWRNALIATGSLMARVNMLLRSPTFKVGLVECRLIVP